MELIEEFTDPGTSRAAAAKVLAPKGRTRIAAAEETGANLATPNGRLDHAPSDEVDMRFADPLVAQITELWRLRQDMVRAQAKLTLQIKAICRRFTAGDRKEADKLYASVQNGKQHPMAEHAWLACHPLMQARTPLEAARKAQEKELARLAKGLPIAHVVDGIRGLNHNSLAAIVGECGDLSAYRDHSAVWKRCGLAVIDGKRQRRVSDAEDALEHGYSPTRRSVIWNVGEALFKAQGKDETAGPYRRIYDQRKEIEAQRTASAAHAHAAACRYMTKRLMRDLFNEWRAVSAATPQQSN